MFSTFAAAILLAAKLEFVVPDANFSLREGLPAVQVLSLYQDRYGALWAGTPAGLARLGGTNILTYGPEQGLSRSAIFAVGEEPSGALVVGTATGISRLVEDRFEPVALPEGVAQQGVTRFVRTRSGTLWALAGERTILRYFEGRWNAVGIDGALAFEATDFAVDDLGAVWLATRNQGLLRLVPSGTRLQKSAQFQPDSRTLVSIDHVAAQAGKVYFTSPLGLSVLEVASGGAVQTVPFPRGSAPGYRSLALTTSGRVFVGTNSGVFTLEADALEPVQSRNDRARAAAISLLTDREGQLWVGTSEGGLNVLLRGRGVRFLRAGTESFRSIDIDRQGVHWVSNENRVVTFRTGEAATPILVAEAEFQGFDALTINAIEEDLDGGLLFAMEGGVGILSRAARAARAAGAVTVRPDPRFEVLRNRLVTGILRDPGGAIWAISPLGVFRLDKDGSEAQSVQMPGGNPWMAAMDAQGSLWVTTRQGSMDRIDTRTLEVVSIERPGQTPVEAVGPSPDGGVVATFANGASAFYSAAGGTTGRVIPHDGPDGIAWLSVRSLRKMGDRYLAAHGGDRLSQIRLDPTRVEQTILTSADLEDADFRHLSLHEGRAGQVWFTLLNGVGLLEPPNAPPPPNPLRVEPAQQTYLLDPRPNSLDLWAQLADPVAPRKARYRYRLTGERGTFSNWSTDPHIVLSNVAPGDYSLEVEAEDRYGRLALPLSLGLSAGSHLYERWPVRLAAALLALLAAYALYRRRVTAMEEDRLALAAAVKAGRADLEAANSRLQELSLTDVLTGLRNRRYFSEVVEDEIRLLKRRFDERGSSGDPNRDAVFFLLDLDRFKSVNDLFGHAGGDAVLKESARRLTRLLRKTDRLIRWGGEEFLVLSLDCQRAEAAEMATRMMTAIAGEPYPIGLPDGVRISTSIGWAAYPLRVPGADPHPEDVVRLADRALYRAKRAGRNCAVGLSPVGDTPTLMDPAEGSAEILRDFGFSATFTLVKGPVAAAGQDLASLRDSGSVRRPSSDRHV